MEDEDEDALFIREIRSSADSPPQPRFERRSLPPEERSGGSAGLNVFCRRQAREEEEESLFIPENGASGDSPPRTRFERSSGSGDLNVFCTSQALKREGDSLFIPKSDASADSPPQSTPERRRLPRNGSSSGSGDINSFCKRQAFQGENDTLFIPQLDATSESPLRALPKRKSLPFDDISSSFGHPGVLNKRRALKREENHSFAKRPSLHPHTSLKRSKSIGRKEFEKYQKGNEQANEILLRQLSYGTHKRAFESKRRSFNIDRRDPAVRSASSAKATMDRAGKRPTENAPTVPYDRTSSPAFIDQLRSGGNAPAIKQAHSLTEDTSPATKISGRKMKLMGRTLFAGSDGPSKKPKLMGRTLFPASDDNSTSPKLMKRTPFASSDSPSKHPKPMEQVLFAGGDGPTKRPKLFGRSLLDFKKGDAPEGP